MNLQPLRSTIYVKLIDPPSGGFIVNSTEPMAEVVAVGPGTPTIAGTEIIRIPSPVKVGDTVLLISGSIGKEFTFGGEKYQAVDESLIIGVVQE